LKEAKSKSKKISPERKNLVLNLYKFIVKLKKKLNIDNNYCFIKIIQEIFRNGHINENLKSPELLNTAELVNKAFNILVEKYKSSRIQTYRTEIDYYTIKDHFFLILEIIDFVFGVSITKMKSKFHMTDPTLNQIARLILGDKFNARFKHTYSNKEILSFTKEFTEEFFKNFLNIQLQKLIRYYRDNKGKSSNNIVRISRKFAVWLNGLEISTFNRLLSNHFPKLTKDELLIKCEIINKNSEIAKFVIYKIMKTEESAREIAKQIGISKTTASNYMKKLKKVRERATREKIKRIAKNVLTNKVLESSFKNFINPELQILLKYYRRYATSDKYLIQPIHSFRIISDFKDWVKKQNVDYKEIIDKVILINKNNEILKCILYRMLKNNWIPVDIANKYNIPRKNVQKIARFLGLYKTLSNKELRDKIIEKIGVNISINDISQDLNVQEDLIIEIMHIINEIRDFEYGRSLTRIAEDYGVSRRPITDIAKNILSSKLYDIRFNDTYFSKYRNIGIYSHKCSNILLTRKFESLYYSEINLFSNFNYRIDGLFVNNEYFRQKIQKPYSKLKLDLYKYNFILFDFTSNLDKVNILDKAKKYYSPYTILFIVGITDMPSQVIKFPEDVKISEKKRILYSKNVRIIRHDLFVELMDFNKIERNIFNKIVINNINVTKNNIVSNLTELKALKDKLSNDCKVNHIKELKKFLKNQTELKIEFNRIQNYVKENQKKIDDF